MGYFPQGSPEVGGLRHLILMHGDPKAPWTEQDLLFYAAHLDRTGRPDDWFYDSFLFLDVKAASGRDFVADVNLGTTLTGEGDYFGMCSPNPAGAEDWFALLDFHLGPEGSLVKLEATLNEAGKSLGTPPSPRNVVLMLPYPHVTQGEFGRLEKDGPSLDFTIQSQNLDHATRQRLAACKWYATTVRDRFAAHSFKHLTLLGCHWMFESIHRGWNVDDHWLLKELRPALHLLGLKLLWSPYWSTYNVHLLSHYRETYFDLAFLQPNYIFYRKGKSLQQAARAARRREAGIALEYFLTLEEPVAVAGERHRRFREYLDLGVHYGYMHAACAHFQGRNALPQMFHHVDPVERGFYEDIYQFVKGAYVPRAADPSGPLTGDVALAVELVGNNLRAAIVDRRGRVHHVKDVPTPKASDSLISDMQVLLGDLHNDARRLGCDVQGIGVSIDGRVDRKSGRVLKPGAVLSGWHDLPLAEILKAATGLPTQVDNDGNCAALGERTHGLGRDRSSFVTIVASSSISGGIVVDDRLLRGAAFAAGGIGHISVDHAGPICPCGNRGCVELYASGNGLVRLAKEAESVGFLHRRGGEPREWSAETLGAAALAGNTSAQALIEKAGSMLGAALVSLVHILNPERVVLTGTLRGLGGSFRRAIRQEIQRRAMPATTRSMDVVTSSLKDGGLLGAASLVLENE